MKSEKEKYKYWRSMNYKKDLSGEELRWYNEMERKYNPQPQKIVKGVKNVCGRKTLKPKVNRGRRILDGMMGL